MGLELDPHPAVALVPAAVTPGHHGVGEGEERRLVTTLLAEAVEVELELVIQHRLEPALGDVAVRLAVDRVADRHVIGRHGFRDRARSTSGPEEPPGDLLPGADLGDRAVPAEVQVDLQGLLQGVRAGFHGAPPAVPPGAGASVAGQHGLPRPLPRRPAGCYAAVVKRAAAAPSSRSAGSRRPHRSSNRSWARPLTGCPLPKDQSMSVAWSAIPSRSTPKKAMFFGRRPASTRPTRCGEAWESSPRGVDTSRPWITSCDSAPSGPPPGGDQGCSMLSRRDASSCAVDNCCASIRARRSAIRSNLPLALTISTTTRGSEYRKGIVVCARTSRTRHPSHRVAASHWGSAREEYRATCSRRSATTAAPISGFDM